MKFGELQSLAHNISDSLASGIGLLVGVYEMDIFAEAACSSEGYIDVDFLTARTSGGAPSPSRSQAIRLYAEALQELCSRHGTTREAFRQLRTRYQPPSTFIVTVEDLSGRLATDTYDGWPGRRALTLVAQGRVRPLPSVRTDNRED